MYVWGPATHGLIDLQRGSGPTRLRLMYLTKYVSGRKLKPSLLAYTNLPD